MNQFSFPWELDLLHWFESIHNPTLNSFMSDITTFGNAGMFWIILTIFLLFFKDTRKIAISMAISLIFSVLFTNVIIKHLVDRARPWVVDSSFLQTIMVALPTDASFPSGHTSASFAAAVAMFCNNKKAGIPALIVALLIAVSRLYLTVHFPTDVIAGTILGAIYGIAAYFVVKAIYKKIQAKKALKTEVQANE